MNSEQHTDHIRNRVSQIDSETFLVKELPDATPGSVDIMLEHLKDQVIKLDRFYMVVDLSEAQRPNADVRTRLKHHLSSMPTLRHAAVVTGKNIIIRIAVKFVIAGAGFKSYSVHKRFEDALRELNAQKQRRDN